MTNTKLAQVGDAVAPAKGGFLEAADSVSTVATTACSVLGQQCTRVTGTRCERIRTTIPTYDGALAPSSDGVDSVHSSETGDSVRADYSQADSGSLSVIADYNT